MVEMSMKSDHYRALDRHGRQSSTKKTVHRRRAEPPGILDRPVQDSLTLLLFLGKAPVDISRARMG